MSLIIQNDTQFWKRCLSFGSHPDFSPPQDPELLPRSQIGIYAAKIPAVLHKSHQKFVCISQTTPFKKQNFRQIRLRFCPQLIPSHHLPPERNQSTGNNSKNTDFYHCSLSLGLLLKRSRHC